MNKQANLKGYWIDDEFLSFIKGHTVYESTYRDARKFSIEIDRVGGNQFPLGEDEKYLTIDHSNKIIQSDLNSFFINKHGWYRDRLFGDHFYLGNFFNDLMQQLVIYNECFYAIDWEEQTIEKRKYLLPNDFRFLRTSTMSVKRDIRGNIQGYKQRYSPFAQLYSSYPFDQKKPRKFDFGKDEVFYVKYPLDKTQPVKKSMYLLKPLIDFWDFAMDRTVSNTSSDKKIKVVLAGQQRFSEQKRKFLLARAQVRKNFHYLLDIDPNDLTITEFYDIFLVSRYKKELNTVRNYFVDSFNEQILTPFATKNNIKIVPQLKLINVITNEEIDTYFNKYNSGEITTKEFITSVVNSKLL